jgi:hypothetical protein
MWASLRREPALECGKGTTTMKKQATNNNACRELSIQQQVGEMCLGDYDPKDVRRFLAASVVFLRGTSTTCSLSG